MKGIKLKIHTWPDPILKKKCKSVSAINEQIRRLFDEMYLVMQANGGIGLAAPQAGIDLQLIIVETKDRLFKLANPRIVKREGTFTMLEGCLSFPGLELKIKRSKRVWISALNERGELIDIEAEDILAVIFQHEIDHIHGICFIDRISFWERMRHSVKLRNMQDIKRNPHKHRKIVHLKK